MRTLRGNIGKDKRGGPTEVPMLVGEEYEGRKDTDPSFECGDGDGGYDTDVGDGDGDGGVGGDGDGNDADPPSEGKVAVFCSNM